MLQNQRKRAHTVSDTRGTDIAKVLPHGLATYDEQPNVPCSLVPSGYCTYCSFCLEHSLSPQPSPPNIRLPTSYPLPFLWLTSAASSLFVITPEKCFLTLSLLAWLRGPSCVLLLGHTLAHCIPYHIVQQGGYQGTFTVRSAWVQILGWSLAYYSCLLWPIISLTFEPVIYEGYSPHFIGKETAFQRGYTQCHTPGQ